MRALPVPPHAPAPFPRYRMTLNNLISKVLAAGLAAGIFLLWWPAHLPSAGTPWLVLRGLAWALAFEILLLSFSPLENMATRALTRRRAAARARRVRGRLAEAPVPAKASGAVVLACTGLLLPGLMLAHAGRPPARPAPRPVQVVRNVVVRKVVREKTVVVRAPALAAQAPAPAVRTAPAAAPAAKKPAREDPAPAKIEATATEPAATQTTAPTTTTPDPIDPSALPNPAEPAASPADPVVPSSGAGY
jgi:hypothetical protein